MQAPRRILLVVTRRIGDVLLATPLIRSLKQAWPQAEVDVLVFDGTQGLLGANPDIHRILTVPERPRLWRHLGLLARIARRYDIALSALPGDRPTLYAWLAGRWRAGLLLDEEKQHWKRKLLQRWVAFDDLDTHTVAMYLRLADVLGIPRCNDVIVSWSGTDAQQAQALLPFDARQTPYAVLHTHPKFNYKMWHREGWLQLGNWLAERGMRVVLTGSGDAEEAGYVAALAQALPGAVNLAGHASLRQAAFVIAHARAFVGPDTVATHAAAALGVPTVALFGPSNPVKWGPWPRGYAGEASPWAMRGSRRVGNVFLVQGPGDCVPCRQEGCDRHVASSSACLQQLPAQTVVAAVQVVLDNDAGNEPVTG